MSPACRIACSVGVILASLLAAVDLALASRPATTVAVAYGRPHAEVAAGHSVSGGGRGPRRVVARDQAALPPPATRAPAPPRGGCLVLHAQAGPRTSPSQTVSRVSASGRREVVRVVDLVRDRRATVAGALFHDANAPPAPATEVAGVRA